MVIECDSLTFFNLGEIFGLDLLVVVDCLDTRPFSNGSFTIELSLVVQDAGSEVSVEDSADIFRCDLCTMTKSRAYTIKQQMIMTHLEMKLTSRRVRSLGNQHPKVVSIDTPH